MCLIMYKEKPDAVFTNRHFKAMIQRNAHGLGIMYIDEDNRVRVDKSVGTAKQKFKLWQKHKHRDHYAMHARLTTHGLTNLDNCHPFKVLSIDDGDERDLYMMHNGVISNAPDINKEMSDTWHFVEYILKPIAKNNIDLLWNNEQFQQWLQTTIRGSKLLFMRSPEENLDSCVLILNSSDGKKVEGCWLSNTHSTVESYTYTPHSHFGGKAATNTPFTNKTTQESAGGAGEIGKKQEDTKTAAEYIKAVLQDNKKSSSKVTYTQYGEEDVEDMLAGIKKDLKEAAETIGNKSIIIPFRDITKQAIADRESYRETLKQLKSQPQWAVKDWVKDNVDDAAEIVDLFYEKNTMPYEVIVAQIKSSEGIDGIVDIIRHCASIDQPPTKYKTH